MDGYALVSRLSGVQVLDKSTYLYYENTRKKVHIYTVTGWRDLGKTLKNNSNMSKQQYLKSAAHFQQILNTLGGLNRNAKGLDHSHLNEYILLPRRGSYLISLSSLHTHIFTNLILVCAKSEFGG